MAKDGKRVALRCGNRNPVSLRRPGQPEYRTNPSTSLRSQGYCRRTCGISVAFAGSTWPGKPIDRVCWHHVSNDLA
jgi:hypothetical protein